jgi:hypothetical protein
VGERIILKLILEIGWGGTDWIDLAQDRDKWRALVNTVMNMAASQEGLSTMDLDSSIGVYHFMSILSGARTSQVRESCPPMLNVHTKYRDQPTG